MRYAAAIIAAFLAGALVVILWGNPDESSAPTACVAVGCDNGPYPTAAPPAPAPANPQIVNPIGDCTPR